MLLCMPFHQPQQRICDVPSNRIYGKGTYTVHVHLPDDMWRSSHCAANGPETQAGYSCPGDKAEVVGNMLASEFGQWLGVKYGMLDESDVVHTAGVFDYLKSLGNFTGFNDAAAKKRAFEALLEETTDLKKRKDLEAKIIAAEKFMRSKEAQEEAKARALENSVLNKKAKLAKSGERRERMANVLGGGK